MRSCVAMSLLLLLMQVVYGNKDCIQSKCGKKCDTSSENKDCKYSKKWYNWKKTASGLQCISVDGKSPKCNRDPKSAPSCYFTKDPEKGTQDWQRCFPKCSDITSVTCQPQNEAANPTKDDESENEIEWTSVIIIVIVCIAILFLVSVVIFVQKRKVKRNKITNAAIAKVPSMVVSKKSGSTKSKKEKSGREITSEDTLYGLDTLSYWNAPNEGSANKNSTESDLGLMTCKSEHSDPSNKSSETSKPKDSKPSKASTTNKESKPSIVDKSKDTKPSIKNNTKDTNKPGTNKTKQPTK